MSTIHISRNRQPLGRFSIHEVEEGLASGRFLPTDLGWREGMQSWLPLSEFERIKPAGGAEPRQTASVESALAPMPTGQEDRPEPAWERREDLGLVSAAFESIGQILVKPAATFEGMPAHAGKTGPLIFNILLSWIGGAAALLFQAVWVYLNPDDLQEAYRGISMPLFGAILFGILVLYPLMVFIQAFVGAGITHACLWLVGGAKQPFQTTFRVLCYANGATAILQLMPICGIYIYPVWYLVCSIIGLSKSHGVEYWRTTAAVLLPILVCCGLLALAAVSILIPIFAGMAQQGAS